MLVVCDIEADSLKPNRLWVIVTKEVKSGEVRVFREPDTYPEEFREYAKGVTGWIGHNFLSFDGPVINKLVPGVYIDPQTIIDTLVVSRLVNFQIEGGHSLEGWGERLGFPKTSFDSSKFPVFLDHWDEGLAYCKQDVEVNYQVFLKLKPYIFSPRWARAMRLEHDTEMMCAELHNNGFYYDIDRSRELLAGLNNELKELEDEFQVLFPPRYKAVREINPVLTKTGKLHSKDFRWCPEDQLQFYEVGHPFTLVESVAFDPASGMQKIDRLWEAGWKPTNKTEGHKDFLKLQRRNRKKQLTPEDAEKLKRFQKYGWKLDEQNLATLPATAPEGAKKLVRWAFVSGRRNQVRGWENEFDHESHRIHGKFWHIGAWSQRMSHSNPNMANASSEHEYRELWTADPGTVLVGCDAEGIQLRILAHYINDPKFTKALVSGDKKNGTDAHSLNAKALGEVCLRWGDKARDRAKTFIYAFVLGATPPKIAEIFECPVIRAEEAVDNFVRAYPGLARLKTEVIPADARRGYFEGFDGRLVRCSSEHLMLAGYLQNGEQVIMKHARRLWKKELDEKAIWHKQVNFVHDEWQTVCLLPSAIAVGQIQARAIVNAGQDLGVNCPQAGEFKIGLNWAETH